MLFFFNKHISFIGRAIKNIKWALLVYNKIRKIVYPLTEGSIKGILYNTTILSRQNHTAVESIFLIPLLWASSELPTGFKFKGLWDLAALNLIFYYFNLKREIVLDKQNFK